MSVLNYTFNKREKVLLLILALILLALLWYIFVWQNAANEKLRIDAEIAETEAQTLVANNRISKLGTMREAIEEQKAAGATPSNLPDYDNTTALMAQLDSVLSTTKDYRLSFDELERSDDGVISRGVTITFGCDSIEAGRAVMTKLENGPFACSIDSATITSTNSADNRTGNARVGVNTSRNVDSPYAVGLHAIFFEKATD